MIPGMRNKLPDVKPRPLPPMKPPLAESDLLEVIKGLRQGWYTTADLYPRYLSWAEGTDHEVVTPRAFGKALRRLVGPDRVKRHQSNNEGRYFLLAGDHVLGPVSPDHVG